MGTKLFSVILDILECMGGNNGRVNTSAFGPGQPSMQITILFRKKWQQVAHLKFNFGSHGAPKAPQYFSGILTCNQCGPLGSV